MAKQKPLCSHPAPCPLLPYLEALVLLLKTRQPHAAAVQRGVFGAQRLCLLQDVPQLGTLTLQGLR